MPTAQHEIDSSEELSVTFFPPLSLQRRGWVFDILRRERVTEIVDIGCGEGELIQCLCNAPPWRDTSTQPPPFDISELATPPLDKVAYIHSTLVHALDISSPDLESAVETTRPKDQETLSEWEKTNRWEDLEVNIWHGGFEAFNQEFVNVECIVSTEVIEHLSEQLLPEFAPMLLGVYHPKLLLITTPSYTFNARFTAPEAPPSAHSGYSDPTGRTNRIFRHSDHKFEWSVDEFKEYCETVAREWGYEAEIGGVGKAVEEDEWGRDEELGFASQVATFRRREEEEFMRMREEKCEREGWKELSKQRVSHQLLATHHHLEISGPAEPALLNEISEKVKHFMRKYKEATVVLREFWFVSDIAVLCGGWVEMLVKAVEDDGELQLTADPSSKDGWESWRVHYAGSGSEEMSTPEDEPTELEQIELDEMVDADWEESEEDREDHNRTGHVGEQGYSNPWAGWSESESSSTAWDSSEGWAESSKWGDSSSGWE